jgi:hypothetical protein
MPHRKFGAPVGLPTSQNYPSHVCLIQTFPHAALPGFDENPLDVCCSESAIVSLIMQSLNSSPTTSLLKARYNFVYGLNLFKSLQTFVGKSKHSSL